MCIFIYIYIFVYIEVKSIRYYKTPHKNPTIYRRYIGMPLAIQIAGPHSSVSGGNRPGSAFDPWATNTMDSRNGSLVGG